MLLKFVLILCIACGFTGLIQGTSGIQAVTAAFFLVIGFFGLWLIDINKKS